jgi:hypothetical protein
MSFWKTFVKVWEVRTSVRIQENIENAYRESIAEQQLNANIPDIINELNEKNNLWERELEHQRNKAKNGE